jgi:hypothetical protein
MRQQEAREQEERQHRVEMRLQQQQHQQATAAAAAAAANQAAQAAHAAASAARSLMPLGAACDLQLPLHQFMVDQGFSALSQVSERGSALHRACELSSKDARMFSVVSQMFYVPCELLPDLHARSVRPNAWSVLHFAVDGAAKGEQVCGEWGYGNTVWKSRLGAPCHTWL